MSSVGGLGNSPSVQVVSTPGTVQTTSSSSSGPTALANVTITDFLGLPLVTNNLGLPIVGAPGDAEAILAAIALKLQQTIGETRNNSDTTAARRTVLALQQINSLISDIADASTSIANNGLKYNQDATTILIDQAQIRENISRLTGSYPQTTSPETLALPQLVGGITGDLSGSQGEYGVYVALKTTFNAALSAYSTADKQVSDDQKAIDAPGIYKTQTLDPLVSAQATLQAKVDNKITLTQAETSQLATLNGDANTPGSVLNARAQYAALGQAATTASGRLANDTQTKASAYATLVNAQRDLAPYLDMGSPPGTVIDSHPQSGSPITYQFDLQAVQSLGTNTTGKISARFNTIAQLDSEVLRLQAEQVSLVQDTAAKQQQIETNQDILNNMKTVISLISSQSGDDSASQLKSIILKLMDVALSRRSFENNESNVADLNASLDATQKIQTLVRQIVQTLASQPIQAALAVLTNLIDALAVLSQVTEQPPNPTAQDSYASSGSRMRIPV